MLTALDYHATNENLAVPMPKRKSSKYSTGNAKKIWK